MFLVLRSSYEAQIINQFWVVHMVKVGHRWTQPFWSMCESHKNKLQKEKKFKK
jgi:hypothetical protein